jgi:hypothetical protein
MPGKDMKWLEDQAVPQCNAIGLSAVHHLREMYPAALKAVPGTAALSLRNHIAMKVRTLVVQVLATLADRLDCLPDEGEPSFVLLARDPQAPPLIESWIAERNVWEPNEKEKLAKAAKIAAEMRKWKQEHPDRGMSLFRVGAHKQVGHKDVKAEDGTTTLRGVFTMAGLNSHLTAFQIYKGPDEYMLHLTDGSTRMVALGFLKPEELRSLYDALGKELDNGNNDV